MRANTKPKRCRLCKCEFRPARSMQSVCGPSCAAALAKQLREREAAQAAKLRRREVAETRVRLKTRGDYLREAQTAFNRYVRLRDANLPCVSCGRFHSGQWHAGHFLSVGARPELRFDERNVWRQCQPCNTHLHGNLILYRIELLNRIGQQAVDELEGPQPVRKWSTADLIAIRDEYRAKCKEMEKISGDSSMSPNTRPTTDAAER